MESLLESFDSFFYVLINTLPVSIGIGFLFFGIGFLLTNPRVKRYRQQINHYKEECARMSRSLANINSQHKDLLETVQAKEQENLVLHTSLETKDEELIGLLDRLNGIAAEADHTMAEFGPRESSEVRNLRRQIAELTVRLKTSESALRDRKIELANARQELASVGAQARGGRREERWQTFPDHDRAGPGETDEPESVIEPDHETETETLPAPAHESREEFTAPPESATDAERPTETETETAAAAETAEPGHPPTEEPAVERAIAAPENQAPETPEVAETPAASEAPDAVETRPEAESPRSAAPPEPSGPEPLADVFADETAELEFQLAQFEERLRRKEAEFFALQEQLSFGGFGARTDPASGVAGTPAQSALEAATPPPDSAASTPAAAASLADSPPASTPQAGVDDPFSAFPPLPRTASPPFPFLGATTAPTPPTPLSPAGAPSTDEIILFRGLDPALWGKNTGPGTVRPAEAPDDMRYLRIRREDTGQSVIIRLEKRGLFEAAPSKVIFGWNGKGETFEGAHHLGVFDHSLPQEVETRFGAGGWGFGHYYGKRGGQAYTWAGMTIARTGFEISALRHLPDPATLQRTHTIFLDDPSIAPSQDAELVFFHSAYPEIWNRNVVDGKGGFALNLCRVPTNTRHVRVRRTDNGHAVIIPASRDELGAKTEDKGALGWNGSNEFFFGGHHLGICDPEAANEVEIKYGCGGYGFGHLVDANDCQAFAWNGEAIARTPFEFTAIARDLTEAELEQLLTV